MILPIYLMHMLLIIRSTRQKRDKTAGQKITLRSYGVLKEKSCRRESNFHVLQTLSPTNPGAFLAGTSEI